MGKRKRWSVALVVVLGLALVPWVGAEARPAKHWGHPGAAMTRGKSGKLLFFASDGMRQDAVERYAARASCPASATLLRARRARVGPRPADPGAAEHRRGLVHADHRRVAGRPRLDQQHVPRQRRGRSARPLRTSGGVPDNGTSILQAETLAQAAERGGKKVAQIEWAGGRSGSIDGPTLDFRNFASGRGVATNYISPSDLADFVAVLRAAVRPPGRVRRRARRSRRRRRPTRPAGPTSRSRISPAKEMRLRVIDGLPAGTDKYGLNAYIYDSKNDHKTRYDRVLFCRTKAAADKRRRPQAGRVGRRQGQDHTAATLDGKTGAFLVKVERLDPDLSHVRLFHTSVTRAIATWPSWPGEPGFTGTFEDFVAEQLPVLAGRRLRRPRVRDRQRGHLHPAGPVLGGSYHPLIKYVLDTYKPDVALVGYPGTDEIQHQFLGLVTKKLPNGAHEPGLRRRRGQRHAGPPRQAARGVHPRRLRGLRRDDAARAGSTCTTAT